MELDDFLYTSAGRGRYACFTGTNRLMFITHRTDKYTELDEVKMVTKGGCTWVQLRMKENLNLEVAKALFKGLYSVLEEKGIYLAAQCCEHLNRAIVVEREAVPFAEIVNVVPQPKAGGSFGTTAYKTFKNPVVVEEIKADAGIDIGGTLIGMHLKKVAVPVRLENNKLGEALVLAARVRPKYIGGERAVYDDKLM